MSSHQSSLTMEQRDILNSLLDQHDAVTLDDVRSCFGLTNDKARTLFEEYLSSLSSKINSMEVQYAISGYKTEGDDDDFPIHRFMIVDISELSEREQYFTKVTSKYLFQIMKNRANRRHCESVKDTFDRMFCFPAIQKSLDTANSSVKIKNPNCKLREKEPLIRVDLDGRMVDEIRPLKVEVCKFGQTTSDIKRKLDGDATIIDGQPPTKKTATDQTGAHSQAQYSTQDNKNPSQYQPGQSVSVKPPQNAKIASKQASKPSQQKQASITSFFKKA